MKDNALHRKVFNAITEHGLLCPGDTVLAAVSGGADSMALLSCLLALKETLGLSRVAAVHVNHGLRGEEARRDEQFVRAWCRDHGVELTVFCRDVAALARERGDGVEEAGRAVRYACFEEARGGDPAVKIATAHTRSDQAETVLLNLLRGAGVHGLSGIPVSRGAVIRPLLTCSRREIEDYCAEKLLPFVTDSTNADPAYRRNYIRGTVLPALKEVNPKAEETLCRTAASASRDDAYLREQARLADTASLAELDTYDTAALAALPDALLCRVLQSGAARQGAGIEAGHMDILTAWLRRGETGSLMLPGGVCAACTPYRCGFVPAGEEAWPLLLAVGETYRLGGRSYRLCRPDDVFLEEIKKVHRKLVIYTLDCDKIIGGLTVTARRAGDRFCPAGQNRERDLKDLLSEAHVLPALRDHLPVVRDAQGIVLAVGVGCSRRVACCEKTQQCLVLAVWGEER